MRPLIAASHNDRIFCKESRLRINMQSKCIIVYGNGKSGSKRVLRLFDLNETTQCRDGALSYSLFRNGPPCHIKNGDFDEWFQSTWDKGVDYVNRHIVQELRLPPKAYMSKGIIAQMYWLAVNKRQLRKILSLFDPELRSSEWMIKPWMYNNAIDLEPLPVFKTGPTPTWGCWILQNRPNASFIHVIRHPGGFLNSYKRRWLKIAERDQTTLDNIQRLREIAEFYPSWATTFGDLDRMSMEESELWYWRYANEMVYNCGNGRRQYRVIKDEDVWANPLSVTQDLFANDDLELGTFAHRYIKRVSQNWHDCTAPWRSLLNPDDVRLVERILDGSVMEKWWEPDVTVSLELYKL